VRLRTKLIGLAASVVFLPVLLVGLVLSSLGFKRIEALPIPRILVAKEWFAALEGASGSLEELVAAGAKGRVDGAIVGKGDELLLATRGGRPAWLDGRGVRPGGLGPREMVWSRPLAVAGYGEVLALARVDLERADPGFDLPLLGGGLMFVLLVAGNALAAGSISRALRSLEASAARLRSGDLDSPVPPPRDPDAARVAEALESLRSSLKEEEARRSRLVMGVSHDFRTPIALIRGYAESLESGVARDEERRARYLRVIQDKTLELDGLVEELLDYARTASDQRRAAAEPADLRAFLAGLAAEFEEDATLGGRRFAFRDEAGAPVPCLLDARLARRAFENLFSNAMRYTEPGGLVELELELVAGDRAVASLSDDGIGVPEEDRERVFEPLYRGSNVGGRRGSGLGLSVVKSVIEGLGWEIACAPRKGGGTRFAVVIPLGAGAGKA